MIDDEYSFPLLNYKDYENIERKVYEMFEELKINKLPIDPFEIANKKGYILKPFSKLNDKLMYYYAVQIIDGISYYDTIKKTYIIHYDDYSMIERQRFTLMHEIGHIILKHEEESELAHQMANCFASYALCPSPLIGICNHINYNNIASLFNVSISCAALSYKRYMSWKIRNDEIKDYEKNLVLLFKK